MHLSGIQKEDIPRVWPDVVGMIAGAIEHGTGRMIVADVYEELLSGHKQLWVVHESHHIAAIVMTEIVVTPNNKFASIIMCTGRGRKDWQHLIKTIEEWAKASGCDRIEAWARPGWQKVLTDYRVRHVELEKIL